jgi:hypothetical protein
MSWDLSSVDLKGRVVSLSWQQLDSSLDVDIFDRQTGKILEQSYKVGEIEQLIKEKPHYDPILPLYSTTTKRSLGVTFLNPQNLIQDRNRIRSLEKKPVANGFVALNSGRHKGKEVSIKEILPGGCYLVTGIQNDIPLMISPDLLVKKTDLSESSFDTCKQVKGDEDHSMESTPLVESQSNKEEALESGE